MWAWEWIHGVLGLYLICDFGHSFKILFVSIVEGTGEEIVKLMFKILLYVKTIPVWLFEPMDIAEPFLNFLLDFLSIELDHCFSR